MSRNAFHHHRRPGFTLLELICVISIIGLLITLTAGAVFRVLADRQEKNTNIHLHKLHMLLDQQWKGATPIYAKEPIPEEVRLGTVNVDGSNNMDRARALHNKLRRRRDFPQTFAEARFNNYGSAALNSAYGPRVHFTNAIGTNPAVSGTAEEEAAVLLYLILTQAKGGGATEIDSVARKGTIKVPANVGADFPVFMDEYGNPIMFRRWLTDAERTNTNDEMNVIRDPDDPRATLAGNWGNSQLARTWFTIPLPTVANPFDNVNRGPTILSAGKDGSVVTQDDLYSHRIQQSNKGN